MKCSLCPNGAYKAPPKGGAPVCKRCAVEIQTEFHKEQRQVLTCDEWWMS